MIDDMSNSDKEAPMEPKSVVRFFYKQDAPTEPLLLNNFLFRSIGASCL
jgi:hypothetical protein